MSRRAKKIFAKIGMIAGIILIVAVTIYAIIVSSLENEPEILAKLIPGAFISSGTITILSIIFEIALAFEVPGEVFEKVVKNFEDGKDKKIFNKNLDERIGKKGRKNFNKLYDKYSKKIDFSSTFEVILKACNGENYDIEDIKNAVYENINLDSFETDDERKCFDHYLENACEAYLDCLKSYELSFQRQVELSRINNSINKGKKSELNYSPFSYWHVLGYKCPNCGADVKDKDLSIPCCEVCHTNITAEAKRIIKENQIKEDNNPNTDVTALLNDVRSEWREALIKDNFNFEEDIPKNIKDKLQSLLENNRGNWDVYLFNLRVQTEDFNFEKKERIINIGINDYLQGAKTPKSVDYKEYLLKYIKHILANMKKNSNDFKNIELISLNQKDFFDDLCKSYCELCKKAEIDATSLGDAYVDYQAYLDATKMERGRKQRKYWLCGIAISFVVILSVILVIEVIALLMLKDANSNKESGNYEIAMTKYDVAQKFLFISPSNIKADIDSAIEQCQNAQDVQLVKNAYKNKKFTNIIADFEADKYSNLKDNNEYRYYVACSYFDIGGEDNEKKSINIMTSLADSKYFYAQIYLANYYSIRGSYYNEGLYDYDNIELTIKYYNEAVAQTAYAEIAKEQYEFACAWLEYHYTRFENPISHSDMVAIYKALDTKGYAFATVWLGKNAEATDVSAAKEYYKRVGAFPDAQVALGVLLCKENRTDEAISYFKLASALNNPEALYQLGVCYEEGLGGISKDLKIALEYYQKSADLGCSMADEKIISLKNK